MFSYVIIVVVSTGCGVRLDVMGGGCYCCYHYYRDFASDVVVMAMTGRYSNEAGTTWKIDRMIVV